MSLDLRHCNISVYGHFRIMDMLSAGTTSLTALCGKNVHRVRVEDDDLSLD